MTLLVLGALAFLPTAAEAGVECSLVSHGVTVEKSCTSPKNSCATDADCTDGVFCNGEEQCATEENPGSNVVDCLITITNPVTHCDSLLILEAADSVNGGALNSDILVLSSAGGATGAGCDAGSNLNGTTETCTLPTGASITFRANYYTIQPGDPDPLPDQATLTVQDLCNAPGTSGCNPNSNANQFGAATDLVSGCGDGPDVLCPTDNLACNGTEFCDEAADACGHQNAPPPCADPVCTACNETTGLCEPIPDPPASCNPEEFCRTPGFWGTHADDDCVPLTDQCKTCSQNITQAAIDAAGGSLDICGIDICNTLVDDAGSAVEAMCMKVQGFPTRQLIRQLTAARLNCVVSGETGGACDGISINDVFDACNAACALGNVTADVGSNEDVSCVSALDCFNNGGQFDFETGDCFTGTCQIPDAGILQPIFCNTTDVPCEVGECVPFPNNCHDAAFPDDFDLPNDSLPSSDPCFEKQGEAGSSDECKAAHKTPCSLDADTIDECDTDVCAP